MWDFSIGRAFGIMGRTMPFLLLRAAVYFATVLAFVIVTGTGSGIGYGLGAAFAGPDGRTAGAFYGGFGGLLLTAGIFYFLRSYILYLVKAGHIAVMVEFIEGKSLPEQRSQVTHGRKVVAERFGQASVLFFLDRLIAGVVGAITGLVRGLTNVLPIPGVGPMVSIAHGFLKIAVGFIDEVILAYAIRTRSTDSWAAARTGLVLYAQNYRPMLKNTAWLAVIVYGLSFLIFLLALAPAGALAYLLPGGWTAAGVVFALLFAWSVKAAFIEPFAVACMIEVYFKTIGDQVPDPEWDAKLERLSGKFRTLKTRAFGNLESGVPRGGPVAVD